MEALVRELRQEIDTVCVGCHYYKDEKIVMEKAPELVPKLERLCGFFLQGNPFDLEEEELFGLRNYVVEALRDYAEALKQRDIVYILDTLDYGFRELLDVFKGEDTEGAGHGEGNL